MWFTGTITLTVPLTPNMLSLLADTYYHPHSTNSSEWLTVSLYLKGNIILKISLALSKSPLLLISQLLLSLQYHWPCDTHRCSLSHTYYHSLNIACPGKLTATPYLTRIIILTISLTLGNSLILLISQLILSLQYHWPCDTHRYSLSHTYYHSLNTNGPGNLTATPYLTVTIILTIPLTLGNSLILLISQLILSLQNHCHCDTHHYSLSYTHYHPHNTTDHGDRYSPKTLKHVFRLWHHPTSKESAITADLSQLLCHPHNIPGIMKSRTATAHRIVMAMCLGCNIIARIHLTIYVSAMLSPEKYFWH
jgi:hypothetical protein